MAKSPALAAHLMPPEVGARLQRPRLLHELDRLRSAPGRRALWIGAASGCGKSTLAAAWLQHARPKVALWLRLDAGDADPAVFAARLKEALETAGSAHSLRAWPAFTREHLARPALQLARCARALFGALPDNGVLVLDDVQTLAGDDAAIAPWLRALIDEVRAGQCLVLLSQRALPSALGALLADGRVAALPAAALAFDESETAAWCALAHHPERAAEWHARSGGWPLALAWLAAGCAVEGLDGMVSAALLSTLQADDRTALDDAAWWPAADARSLGDASASRLQALAARGWPIDATGAGHWRLHDLLRQALQREQRERVAPARLAQRLAGLAERWHRAGNDDAAIELRLEAAALDAAMHLAAAEVALCAVAPTWLAASRHAGVRAAAARIPEAQRSAALWWWLAQAELPRSPSAARACADRALALVGPDDRALAIQCHVLVIATHFQSFDDTRPLAARVAALRALGVTPESIDVTQPSQAATAVGVWSALYLRQPTHPDEPAWNARVRALLREAVDPNLKLRAAMLLSKQAWQRGEHAQIATLPALVRPEAERAGVLPYARLLWGLMRQYATWTEADWNTGLAATRETLAEAQTVGIHLLDQHLRLHGACFASIVGDEQQAQRWLHEVTAHADASRHMEVWHHFSVRAWLALRAGQAATAEAASRVAIEASQAMGPAPHTMALAVRCHALQALDDGTALRSAERELAALADATDNRLGKFHLRLLDARRLETSGDREGTLMALQSGLRSAREAALWAPFGAEPQALARLLAQAIEADIERDAAQRMARALRLVPPANAGEHWPWAVRLVPPANAGEHWPWAVRVHTIGRFELEVNGHAPAGDGKQQKRPLELLQALIACGGAASTQRLADLLWPEAEGDRALDAFEVALRRLRQLLGDAEVLPLRGGRLMLDEQRVWVDVLHGPAITRPRVAVFLPDQAAPWALAARERLARGAPLAAIAGA